MWHSVTEHTEWLPTDRFLWYSIFRTFPFTYRRVRLYSKSDKNSRYMHQYPYPFRIYMSGFNNWARTCSLWSEVEETVKHQPPWIVYVENRNLNLINFKSARLWYSIVIECKSVTWIRRNFTVWFKILAVLLEGIHVGLHLGENVRANALGMLRYADIPNLYVYSIRSEYFVWDSDCSFFGNNKLSTKQ